MNEYEAADAARANLQSTIVQSNAKEAFKTLYSYARWYLGRGMKADAYLLADQAVRGATENGHRDATGFLRPLTSGGRNSAFDATLWAIHWRFCEPKNTPPVGLSEKHLCFEADPSGTRTWFARRLPS